MGSRSRAWRAQMVAPDGIDTTGNPFSASSDLTAGLEHPAGVAAAAIPLALARGSGSADGYLFCLGCLV